MDLEAEELIILAGSSPQEGEDGAGYFYLSPVSKSEWPVYWLLVKMFGAIRKGALLNTGHRIFRARTDFVSGLERNPPNAGHGSAARTGKPDVIINRISDRDILARPEKI